MPDFPELHKNPVVIFRRESDKEGLLFHSETGKIFSLNATGTFIVECLEQQLPPEEILEKMQEKFQAPAAKIREDLQTFLSLLRQLGYFAETPDGPATNTALPSEIPETLRYYQGSSMYPTLLESEEVKTIPLPFAEFQKGDIIVFPAQTKSSFLIHRIIRRTENALYTMGDNNLQEDGYAITEKDHPRLAVEKITTDGIRLQLQRGRAGWRRFLRLRIHIRLRQFYHWILRPFSCNSPQ